MHPAAAEPHALLGISTALNTLLVHQRTAGGSAVPVQYTCRPAVTLANPSC